MSSREKIDSIYDFSDKGLVELKAWLEPWMVNRDGAASGDGIQFDTDPQTGDWLLVDTTGYHHHPGDIVGDDSRSGGIVLHANDGGGMRLLENGGGGLFITSGSDGDPGDIGNLVLAANGDAGTVSIDAHNVSLNMPVGGLLSISELPTTDPSFPSAIWSDGGTLVLSGFTAGSGGGGIQFGVANSGSYLHVFTNDATQGISLVDNGGGGVNLDTTGGSGGISLMANGSGDNQIYMSGLPTTDPGISDAVWNDGGTLKVSP